MNKIILFIVALCYTTSMFAKKPMNVLFLMADDFNYWTSKNGYYPHAKTPNIDALANKGVFFSDAHCSSPVCEPSRNALWSGLRPSTTCLDENGDGYIRQRPGLENHVTMNQFFMKNGYYVYGSGKLYHPGKMSKGDQAVDADNWSELNEMGTGCNGGKLYKFGLKSKGNYKWSANEDSISGQNCADLALANEVARVIGQYSESDNADKPFFIACGFFRPHMPWNSPVEYWNRFNIDSLTTPPAYNDSLDAPGDNIHQEIVENNMWMQAIQAYLASCALADDNVGIVLEALEKSPYAKNTIVVFCGDHGWNLGEKGRWGKFDMCDEANHTSLVIYNPKAKGNGKVCEYPVGLQDIYPTLVDICNVPENNKIEGNSLKPLLKKPNYKKWDHPVLMTFNETNYIKTREWRFIDNGEKSMLTNNYDDPYQWNNLYGHKAYAPVVKQLRKEIDSIVSIGAKIRDENYPGTKGLYGPGCDPKMEKRKNNDEHGEACIYPMQQYGNKIFIDLSLSNPMVHLEISDGKQNILISEAIAGEIVSEITLENSLPTGKYFLTINDGEIKQTTEFRL